MRRVLIAGYYGFGNLGDEAILAAILRRLRAACPDLRVWVTHGGFGPPQADPIPWNDPETLVWAVRTSDLVILGGGGLFFDYWPFNPDSVLSRRSAGLSFYATFPLLAALLDRPLVLWGVGVGPLNSEAGRRLTRLSFLQADYASVRDEESAALLTELGVPPDRFTVTADPAFDLEPVPAEVAEALLTAEGIPRDRPLLAVALRGWNVGVDLEVWTTAVAAALDEFVRAEAAAVLFVPFQRVEEPLVNDTRAIEAVLRRMARLNRTYILRGRYTPAEVAGILGRCGLVLGMRMHSLILGAVAGVGSVALMYDPKVGAAARRLGLRDYVLDLRDFSAQELVGRLRVAWARREELGAEAARRARELAEIAAGNVREVLREVEKDSRPRPLHPEVVDWIRKLALSRSLSLARAEADREVDQVLAVQRPGSKLRALLRRAWRHLPPVLRVRTFRVRHRLTTFVSTVSDLRAEKLKGYRRELAAILGATNGVKGIIIYPSTLDWNFMFQRPQQLARALARQGFLFFFRTPNAQVDQVQGFKKVSPNLYVCHVPWRVFEEIPSPVLFISWAVQWSLIDDLKDPIVVYDCVDDLEVGSAAEEDHREMLRRAHLVLATAGKLYEAIYPVRPDVVLCPNAADYDTFVRARERAGAAPPPDLVPALTGRKPVVGYHGALARCFDYGLLTEVARRLPEAAFVLIGCDYDGTLAKSPIPEVGNVFWLGMKPYDQLVDYIRWFDVCIIPFLLNKITEACSPIKLWEYLAAGKPVVSTDLPMCRGIEGVLIARSAEEFACRILEAADLARDETFRNRLDAVVRRETWDARASVIATALEKLLATRADERRRNSPTE